MGEEHRKRKRKLNVYLLDEEWEILNAKADEAEMLKSEYIRNVILFGAAHKRTLFSKEATKEIIYEINRIGNNLNQIAYRANANRKIDERDFQNLYDNYVELLGDWFDFAWGKYTSDC